jgi:hypothetical protein
MSATRRTISLSLELDAAICGLASERGESVSALVETLLREHALVQDSIELGRMEAKIVDFGIRPGKNSPLRKVFEEALKRPSPSGEAAPKTRRKEAARP